MVLGVAIMICSGWAIFAAASWPWKAALFPIAIGIPVFCLAAVEVAWALFGSDPAEKAMDFEFSGNVPGRTVVRRTVHAAAWMLGLFGAIVLLSFPIAVPLFVFLYVKLQGGESWRFTIIASAAVWGFFYAVFDRLLHLPFPAGWIQTAVGLG
jgi:hypothetical protein